MVEVKRLEDASIYTIIDLLSFGQNNMRCFVIASVVKIDDEYFYRLFYYKRGVSHTQKKITGKIAKRILVERFGIDTYCIVEWKYHEKIKLILNDKGAYCRTLQLSTIESI